jgi:hypothetical protein
MQQYYSSMMRDADRVLTRAGQALAEGDLREEVAVHVTIGSAD